ncbi:MAG: hypothetical protein R2712_18005 [Vicinamibacterales bacterium]
MAPCIAPDAADAPTAAAIAVPATKPDVAFWAIYAFTALLFFRPQDTLPFLEPLHLSDIAAVTALVALVVNRLSRGKPVISPTPELWGWRAWRS